MFGIQAMPLDEDVLGTSALLCAQGLLGACRRRLSMAAPYQAQLATCPSDA